MKPFRLRTLFIFVLTLPCFGGELHLEISDPPADGQYRIMVFDSATAFSGFRAPWLIETFPVNETIVVSNLPNAEMAWVLYLDENANGYLDKNFIGIPKEPLALSNGYFPKGPPNFQAATITLNKDETKTEQITLRRPLGKLGRVGVGAGIIGRGSLYEGFDGAETQVIPAITYLGDRLQLLGPSARLGLTGSGKLRLALAANLEIAAYKEEDSAVLEGLGDRKTTLFAGPAIQFDGPEGIDLALSYQHDVLDQIGGGRAGLTIDKSFQVGRFSMSPSLGANWMSGEVAQHLFGVPGDRATEQRPAYSLGDQPSFELGSGGSIFLSSNSQIIISASYEWFGSDIADSPITKDDGLWKAFAAITWVF